MVRGDVGLFVNRRDFVLAGRNFIVARFGRNAQLEELFLHVVHEGGNALLDAAEVLILELLAFRRRRADDRPAAQDEILTLVVVIHVDQEILLFGTEIRVNLLHVFGAQQLEHAGGALAQRADGAQ